MAAGDDVVAVGSHTAASAARAARAANTAADARSPWTNGSLDSSCTCQGGCTVPGRRLHAGSCIWCTSWVCTYQPPRRQRPGSRSECTCCMPHQSRNLALGITARVIMAGEAVSFALWQWRRSCVHWCRWFHCRLTALCFIASALVVFPCAIRVLCRCCPACRAQTTDCNPSAPTSARTGASWARGCARPLWLAAIRDRVGASLRRTAPPLRHMQVAFLCTHAAFIRRVSEASHPPCLLARCRQQPTALPVLNDATPSRHKHHGCSLGLTCNISAPPSINFDCSFDTPPADTYAVSELNALSGTYIEYGEGIAMYAVFAVLAALLVIAATCVFIIGRYFCCCIRPGSTCACLRCGFPEPTRRTCCCGAALIPTGA